MGKIRMPFLIFSLIYLLLSGIHLFFAYKNGEYPDYQAISKIAVVPVLILFAIWALIRYNRGFFGAPTYTRRIFPLVIIALVFSTFGDYFLIQETDDFFLYGLGSFLIAHILYGISFILSKEKNYEIPLIYKAPIYMLLILLTCVFIYIYLKPGMGELDLPVVIYMSAILFMTLMALNRYRKVGDKSFWYVFIGSLTFMASDTIIAFNRFNSLISNAEFYVMLTYFLAQYLIVSGSIIEAEKRNSQA